MNGNGNRCAPCPPGGRPPQYAHAQSPRLTAGQQQAANAIENQVYVTPFPYYSKVKFRAVRAGAPGGPYNWNIAAGVQPRAFSYGIGGSMLSAGFTPFDGLATIADTNITDPATTISGEVIHIQGIAIQPLAAALDVETLAALPIVRPIDNQLLAAISEAVSVELVLNGGANRFKLGIPPMVPGAGGLSGGAQAVSGRPALAGGVIGEPYPTNGWAVRNNFFRMPEGLTWNRQGMQDSQLEFALTVQRPIQIFSGGSPEVNLGAVVAGAGVQAYDYPTTLVAEFMVHLAAVVSGPRSRVQ
ncbi:MAG: hypothetical protein A2V88_08270 [Elusimicrobia bacterium RBG_16_66_12]|nr:MAG: hypothetical protein A2V88_08270 [Elusimicrobia bacterium RBG_16_66_12]